jgi:hypothetical protein
MAENAVHGLLDRDVALVELVNRVVDRGVVLSGEVTISVAEVDLLYLGIKLLLCPVDRVYPHGLPASTRTRLPVETIS